MPAPNLIFPRMEGIVSALGGAGQRVALWVETMKKIMLSDTLKDKTDWEFAVLADIDETGAAAMVEALTSRAYGLLVGQKSADAGGDFVAIVDDAGGGYTFDGTAALAATFRAVHYIPAATVDLTEEFWGFVYPEGTPVTTDIMVVADGTGGVNPDTDDMRAWLVYRTIDTE